jgi:hypothetical protein
MKIESGLISDLELWCGSPFLCQMRTNRVAPMNKIDYVLAHTGFMWSYKLSSFDGRWVGQSLTNHVVMYIGIVYGSPKDSPACGTAWKTCTRERCGPVRLFNRCHELCSLMVPVWLTCYQVVILQGYIDSNLRDTIGYGWCLFAAVIS